MNRDTARQTATIASLGLTLTINALANTVKINGRATGEISNNFANFFVPSGYVFAIWSLIYLGLIGFVIYQALPAQATNARLRRVGWWFVASNLFNTAWLFSWHYEQYALSMLMMSGLLAALAVIYTRLDPDRALVKGAQRWLVNLPFSIYLGWITVAVIPNASVTLIAAGWDGFGLSGEVWAVVLLGFATVIGALVALPRRDWAYAAVLVWAFVGIGVKFAELSLLANAAYLAAAVVAVIVVFCLVRDWGAGRVERSAPEAA
ncbi:MAG: tryptophan-rich sensory protein [Roseiflexaceae bacterium]|nr:tryptophan-rich sensory protein [Roseiflexaceae bacterium]